MYIVTSHIWDNLKKMEAAATKALIFWLTYVPLLGLGMLTFDHWKQLILLAYLLITGSIWFKRKLRRDDQNYRQKELELKEREWELNKKQAQVPQNGQHI